MPDREKVIKGLETIRYNLRQMNHMLLADFCDDALSLLKEQEAKAVEWRLGRAHCPSCGELFPKKQEKQYIRFCSWCGQAVKWNDD